MTTAEDGKKYALVAAICYAIYAACSIIRLIIRACLFEYSIPFSSFIYWIILIGLAVALFLKNEAAVAWAAGTDTLLWIFSLFSYFYLSGLLYVIADAVLFTTLVLDLKGNNIVKKIWFVPGLVVLIGRLIEWITYDYFLSLSSSWLVMMLNILQIVALLFTGIWIAEPFESAPASAGIIGVADKLKMYKDLLDNGIITQEEFDAKKKQLLGL